MVRSQKSIGGVVGVAVGNAPYKIGYEVLGLVSPLVIRYDSSLTLNSGFNRFYKWANPPLI